ncbi:membrane protein [Bacteroidia bacterium]|nr:membrane protein [Bacteroidia bacterium]
MKKIKLSVVALAVGISALLVSSCIGSFGLTNKVLKWNQKVTNQKWINELVYLVFWVVPVYEISLFIDGVILNTIEFWSGSSPLSSVDKVIKGTKGEYHVKSNANGYDIEFLSTGEKAQLLFDQNSKTWSIAANNTVMPLVQFDENNIAQVAFNAQSTPSLLR